MDTYLEDELLDDNEIKKIPLSESEMRVRKKYHLTLNKMFIQNYSINFALLLSEIDRITFTSEHNSDEEGFQQLSYNLFQRDIRLSKGQVKPLVDEMIELHFLEIKYTHKGRRKLYRLNRDAVQAKLIKLIKAYESRKRK